MAGLSLRQVAGALGRALSDPVLIDVSHRILHLVAADHFGLRSLLHARWLAVGSGHADTLGLSLRRLADQVVARRLLEVDVLLLYLKWLVRERRPLLCLLDNLLLSLLLDCGILEHFRLVAIERVTLIL